MPLNQWTRTLYALLFATSLAFSGSANAVTANLEAAKDNTLYEDINGLLSNGSGPNFFVGNTLQGPSNNTRRGLIMFDIASELPPDAVVTSATLSLTVDLVAGSGIGEAVELYRVATDWGEEESFATGGAGGGGAGGAALSGDATWTHARLGSDPWVTAGGDFVSTASAVQSVGPAGDYSWSSTQLTEDIQDMLLEPQNNFGWILIGNESFAETAKRFTSRESLSPPMLTIEYDVPGGVGPDFDGDGDVDADDLAGWSDAYGSGDGGDANSDGDSDGADYLAWQNEFTGPGGLQASVVPEPSSLFLAGAMLTLGALNRRTRR